MVQGNKDFDMTYPTKQELRVDEGWLTEEKGKTAQLLFKFGNGAIQRLHPSGTSDFLKTAWFRNESDQPIWHKARIAWFRMPSGRGWLAVLELEGNLLADYEQRRQDFYAYKDIRDHHPASRLLRLAAQYLYYAGFGLVALAYLASWFQLKKENTHG